MQTQGTTVQSTMESERQIGDLVRRDPTLAEIVRRLARAYASERIYLFGSRGRGEPSRDGDYDLLVVVPDSAPTSHRGSSAAYDALWGTGAAADILVQTRSYLESRLHLEASLPATVVREGKLIYESGPGSRRGDQGLAAEGF